MTIHLLIFYKHFCITIFILFFVSKGGMDIVELNEMCRFLLYTPGQKFSPHRDGCFVRPADAGEKGKEKCMIVMYFDEYHFNPMVYLY